VSPNSFPTRTVVGSILLAADQQLRVEQLAVGAGSDFVDWRRVQVDEDGTGDVFAAASLGEEGLVGTALTKLLRIGVGTTIGEQTVLEEVPGITVSTRLRAHAVSRQRTAPRRCYPAGYQLGRCEGGRSVELGVSSVRRVNSSI
jgi:hypothetical protein